jgi:hypothetical protein
MRGDRKFTSAISNLKSALPLLALCAFFVGCAAPSPPLPPSLELPTPVSDLQAIRKGNKVVLTWTLPTQTTDGAGIHFRGLTRVCRSLSNVQDKMTGCGTPAAQLASSQLDTSKANLSAKGPQRVSARYTDPLPNDWLRDPTATVIYAIESLNTSHRSAGLSNQVRVPAASTEPPPADFAAQLGSQGVVLTWTGPLLAIPGSNDMPHYFYRVFRTAKDAPQPILIGEIQRGTQDKMRLVDNTFVWEKEYEYRINVTTRTRIGRLHACPSDSPTSSLALCKDLVDIPGDDSALVMIVAHDIFPPSVPTALQAVFSGTGQKPFIDLIWNANTDADLTGYNVYRREGSAPPVRINTELAKAPAYRDTHVASGQTYFYSVAAVDARGNESARSEEASEQVP